MQRQQPQRKSARVPIIIGLVVITLGVFGYVLWSSFLKDSTPVRAGKEKVEMALLYQNFTTDKYGVSFQHPREWGVTGVPNKEDTGLYTRTYSMTIDESASLTLATGVSRVENVCDDGSKISVTVVDAERAHVRADRPVFASYVVFPGEEGTYVGVYGLTDIFTRVQDYPTCSVSSYMYIDATKDPLGFIGFSGQKSFATLQEAKEFSRSDTYHKIKQTVSSLKYE